MISWRAIQKQNIKDLATLAQFLELSPGQTATLLEKPRFSLNLPMRLAHKIEKRTLDDPLFRQFVPVEIEGVKTEGYSNDPVGDCLVRSAPQLLHKYQGRALLVVSAACAMHCRYCFRQNFTHEHDPLFERELAAIRADETIQEIILSGGDPLSLSDAALDQLISSLEAIPHLTLLRFHTRFPIGIPERITPELIVRLSASRLQVVFIIHINHARELDKEVASAMKTLQKQGIPVLTQTVLLKGVNDSVEVLYDLFNSLIQVGILPYYLHQLDKVNGAAHFEVLVERGKELIEQLRNLLPGYAIPRYVEERSGEASKTPL